MRKKSGDVIKRNVQHRVDDSLSDVISHTLKLTLIAILFGLFLLVTSMMEGNEVYLPYAIYTIVQFSIIYVCAYRFQTVRKYRLLLLALVLFVATFLLERYHMGALFEPMKDKLPSVVGTGYRRSVGLVKSLAIMAPTLYFWAKILLGTIWFILLAKAMSLKKIDF
ncbi:MAG: hypothetical protein NXI10_04165 [bacterium]|nr:hypothetical protein [bacterium]